MNKAEKEQNRMTKIIEALKEEYPNSKVSLDYHNAFELLVATMLSAQSTDAQVNKVLPGLFKAYPDAQSMSKVKKEDIIPHIKSIGLFNNKAMNLANMAKMLMEKHDGKVPSTMEELVKLPGVGRKTANVVLGHAFNKAVGITVDTHVIRLSNRMGFVEGKNAVKIERELMEITEKKYWTMLTLYFIDHGRKICGRKPKCDECVVSNLCWHAIGCDCKK